MRSMCIYELGTDYIKYAKWLGMKEHKIVFYMFRNAMLPQLTGLYRNDGWRCPCADDFLIRAWECLC